MTHDTAPSQAQSLQESLAQSMVQMSQALVASAAQTAAMLAHAVGRLLVLKLDGRGSPKVKAIQFSTDTTEQYSLQHYMY